jgi:hypothetical protein
MRLPRSGGVKDVAARGEAETRIRLYPVPSREGLDGRKSGFRQPGVWDSQPNPDAFDNKQRSCRILRENASQTSSRLNI